MKSYPRLSPYKTENDPLSAFLSEFRFDVEYFTNWPQQDHKTLRNIVGSQMKLVLLESGHSTLSPTRRTTPCPQAAACSFRRTRYTMWKPLRESIPMKFFSASIHRA